MSEYRRQFASQEFKDQGLFSGSNREMTRRYFNPEETVEPRHLFLSSGSNPQFTTQRNINYVIGEDYYGDWSEREQTEYEKQKEIYNAVPSPQRLQKNLYVLSQLLNKIRHEIRHKELILSSALRMPEHNAAIDGASNSRHIKGLAADITMKDLDNDFIPPLQLAQMIYDLPGDLQPEAIIGYPDNTFVHVQLPHNPRTDFKGGDYETRLLQWRNGSAVPFDGSPVAVDQNGEEFEDESHLSFSFESTSIHEGVSGLKEELGVLGATDPEAGDDQRRVEEPYEAPQLGDRRPPGPGEIDIGDMRFGSVKFEEARPEELNQPTSVSQQNAGSVMRIPMIRTDMDPVAADTRVSPEIIMTLTVNATTRDDVNNVLRPLVAMQRRFPFCPIRNRHVTNLMLGVGFGVDNQSRLAEMYPEMSEDQLEDMVDALPNDLAELWVPAEMEAISIDTQPGASGLFQVHMVMRKANILPYVPELSFWKDTESAIQWARYVSIRSMNSTTVIDQEDESATVVTPTDSVMEAEPPNLNIEGRVATRGGKAVQSSGQTISPYQSYPFKKFYRGLLEEFQPVHAGGYYDILKSEGRTEELRPIGQTGTGADVYEPAYPIEDPRRLFEVYNPTSPIGLSYTSVSGSTSRDARFDRVVADLTAEIEKIEDLASALTAVDITSTDVEEMGDVGIYNYAVALPSSRVGEIVTAFEESGSAMREAYGDFTRGVSADTLQDILQNEVVQQEVNLSEEDLNIENDQLRSRVSEEALTRPSEDSFGPLESAFYTHGTQAFGETGPMDFKVPDATHQQVYVSFSTRLDEIQNQLLQAFVRELRRMSDSSEWGYWGVQDIDLFTPGVDITSWQGERDPVRIKSLDANGPARTGSDGQVVEPHRSGWFDVFISGEILRYIRRRNENGDSYQEPSTAQCLYETPSGQSGSFERVDYTNAGNIPEGFGGYMLSQEFFARLVEFTDRMFEDWWPNTPLDALQRFKELKQGVGKFTQSIVRSVKERSGTVERGVDNRSEEMQGYLALQNATMEHTRIRFTNKFGRKEWDGYPEPVSQHIGGGNAEITLEFTTNNRLLLDQLGELKRSQAILTERRKSEHVVPPLVHVRNAGNLLRSLGIKRCAYHSHTQNMAERRPGYYKVRLELIQDEETLTRTETFTRVGGTTDGRIMATGAVGPLTLPVRGFLDPTTGTPLYNQGDVSSLYLFDRFFDDVEPRSLANSDFEDVSIEDSDQYFNLEDPSLEEVLERRFITVDVRYELDRDPEQDVDTGDPGRFLADIRWRDGNDVVRTKTDIDISDILVQLRSFLHKTRGTLPRAQYTRLIQRIEGALSTNGGRKGLIAAWYDLAVAQIRGAGLEEDSRSDMDIILDDSVNLEEYETPQYVGGATDSFNAVARYKDAHQRDLVDNLSNVARQLIGIRDENDLENLTYFVARPFQLASAELANIVLTNNETYNAYRDWLVEVREDMPLQASNTISAAENARAAVIRQQNLMPSAYTDLLMPALKDPVQDGTNILGWDFAFGPGESEIMQDQDMGRYEYADDLRQVANVRMASMGLELLDSYLGEDDQNVSKLEGPFDAAVENLRETANNENIAGEVSFLPTEGSGSLRSITEHIEENPVFSSQLDTQITQQNLLEAHRLSKTIEYVVTIIETANTTQGAVDIQNPDGSLNDIGTERLQSIFDAIDQDKPLDITGGVSIADTAESVQSSSGVQEYQNYLRKMRDDLIKLYEAGTNVLNETYGYRDQFSEARRHRLMNKLRDTWKGHHGMRRAFPSYMITLNGKLGTGVMETLSDVYSWTAVGEIEVREGAESAGQYINLTLSNMRKRIVADEDYESRADYGSYSEEGAGDIEITAGTHMQVFLGYGPDTAHMEGWAGRVTTVEPGQVTRVEVSSYSSTLNNPPNKGKGFFVDGWDGQQTISEAVLYTISQTSGLEGLGRKAPGAALDRYGRRDRGNQMDDYRANLMSRVFGDMARGAMDQVYDKGDPHGRSGTLFDAMHAFGRDSFNEWVYGNSQIYENIWIDAAQEEEGTFGKMLFGGLSDWMTGGKGWGWAALPGETAWKQLKEQSKLFEDFVVTTRPYNTDIPLSQIALHPPRQTLYFGPKTGSYIHSSREPSENMTFVSNTEEVVEGVIDEQLGGDRFESLVELFNTLFIPALMKAADTADQAGAGSDATGRAYAAVSDYAESLAGSISGIGNLTFSGALALTTVRSLRNRFPNTMSALANPDVWEEETIQPFLETGVKADDASSFTRSLDQALLQGFSVGQNLLFAFPAATRGLQRGMSDDVGLDIEGFVVDTLNKADIRQLIGLWYGDNVPSEVRDRRNEPVRNIDNSGWFSDRAYHYQLSQVDITNYLRNLFNDEMRSVMSLTVQETMLFIRDIAQRSEIVMDAFQKDLVEIATNDSRQQMLSEEDNKLFEEIDGALRSEGMVPDRQTKPIQRHHFATMYENVAEQNILATDNAPFANSVTLTFPTEPDKRLAAYMGHQGEQHSYQVQAAPTISEDHMVEAQVFYPNVRYAQADFAASVLDQVDNMTESGGSLGAIQEKRDEVIAEKDDTAAQNDRIVFSASEVSTYDISDEYVIPGGDGQAAMPRYKAVEVVETKFMRKIQEELGPHYVRPKHSTVAVNVLKDKMRHMYTGNIVQAGRPDIHPYHILHLWDDVQHMHGPVEVDKVYHRFDTAHGFYTEVEPKLVSYMRGADEGFDTQWLESAGQIRSMLGTFSRSVSAVGAGAGFIARVAGYGMLALAVNKYGSKGGYITGNYSGIGEEAGFIGGLLPLINSGSMVAKGFWVLTALDATRTVLTARRDWVVNRAVQHAEVIQSAMDSNPVLMLPLTKKGKPFTAGLTGAIGPASRSDVSATDVVDEQGNQTATSTFQMLVEHYSGGGVEGGGQ